MHVFFYEWNCWCLFWLENHSAQNYIFFKKWTSFPACKVFPAHDSLIAQGKLKEMTGRIISLFNFNSISSLDKEILNHWMASTILYKSFGLKSETQLTLNNSVSFNKYLFGAQTNVLPILLFQISTTYLAAKCDITLITVPKLYSYVRYFTV